MKRKRVYVRKNERVEQLVKTASKKRGTYVYRRYTDTYVEEIELVPGEDGITAEDIKTLHAADDHEVYENLKSRRPKRTDEEQSEIEAWKAEYIRKFKEEHGYEPHPADVEAETNDRFPKNWTTSLDAILDGNDDNGAGDKSAILAKAYHSTNPEPGFEEMADEIALTWSESWQEIYFRVLRNGETIVSIARERGVTEGAVRKTVTKIRKALAENTELRKFVRFFD